jgi:hypothetical protein
MLTQHLHIIQLLRSQLLFADENEKTLSLKLWWWQTSKMEKKRRRAWSVVVAGGGGDR